MQKRAKLAWLVRLVAAMIAILLVAATGSCDAGGVCEGHVRSVTANVRVDAAVDRCSARQANKNVPSWHGWSGW